ncbi:unnamed protein product, partial [Brassica napus]
VCPQLLEYFRYYDAHQQVIIINTHLLCPHDSTLSMIAGCLHETDLDAATKGNRYIHSCLSRLNEEIKGFVKSGFLVVSLIWFCGSISRLNEEIKFFC